MKKQIRVTRRTFFQGALGFAAAAAGISPDSLKKKPVLNPEGVTPGKDPVFRTLGKTGLRLPVVSMGVMNADNPALVRRSFELGVRHFDTAAVYQGGRNEEMVGQVIQDMKVRDRVVIGTKVFVPHVQREVSSGELKKIYLETADASLRRLRTDYLDILYSHNVQDTGYLNNPGILEALRILKKQGKVRFIGFSVHTSMAELIENAVQSGYFDVILTVYNYAHSENTRLRQALDKAARQGIGLIAMKTQCSQYWYSQRLPESQQKFYRGSVMHTAVLKWALRNEAIATAVPGYTTFEQMEQDFSVSRDLEFTPEEEKFLKDRDVETSLGYCLQCGACDSTCPHGVPVRSLMRCHLYATCYANFTEARETLNRLPEKNNLTRCVDCSSCTARCVNGIDIPRRIGDLIRIYG
jgi:predicted aldo/keto reductase-like oxidoreductase